MENKMNLKSEDKNFIVISGNNIDSLKDYPDNYFDSVVTDPPYGLGKEPNAEEMLRAWIDTGYLAVGGSGFMGKEWDAFVPQPLFWKEIFRVLKHGGHIVAFFGTRTYDWGCMAIRLAGFEIRDCIQWVYGCLSEDTEILTENGWVEYSQFRISKKGSIFIYNKEKDEYFFETPEKWNEYKIKDTCYRIQSDYTDQIVSRNHRCVVERKGKLLFEFAENLAQERQANIPFLESFSSRTQTIRVGKTYSTTLATITPFEYTGVIFCPTVSTGCFVARRNGKIFITGNSGFPKSHNISLAIDKMKGAERDIIGKTKSKGIKSGVGNYVGDSYQCDGYDITAPSTDQAKQWEGWGSAIKPANEPIVLARKPLEKGLSIAQNVLKWGTGAINIDASRIGNELIKGQKAGQGFNNVKGFGVNTKLGNEEAKEYISEDVNGRFPSNFILGHHFDCEMKIEKTIYTDTNEEEANEVWNCHDDCPIKILDEQSGELKSGKMTANHNRTTNGSPNGIYGKFDVNHPLAETYGDKGGASRFFYVAKASQWERNFGLDNFEKKQVVGGGGLTANLREDGSLETASAGGKFGSIKALKSNIHPTVKPIKLMQYLVRMITPPNGIVLDPFAGSGTTGIACKIDGFNFVGLELSEEYTEIANSRIESFKEEKVFIDETIIYKTRNKEEEEEDENHQLSLF